MTTVTATPTTVTRPAASPVLRTNRFGAFDLVKAAGPSGAIERVRRYFAGDLGAFDDAVLDAGGSAFQQRAWSALREIPAGTTVSYAQQAARLGAGTRLPLVLPHAPGRAARRPGAHLRAGRGRSHHARRTGHARVADADA